MESVEAPIKPKETSFLYIVRDWYQSEDGIVVKLQGVEIRFHCYNNRNFDISKPLKLIVEVPFAKP
jgi:hypothetical protein